MEAFLQIKRRQLNLVKTCKKRKMRKATLNKMRCKKCWDSAASTHLKTKIILKTLVRLFSKTARLEDNIASI